MNRRVLPWASAVALHILLVLFVGYLIRPPAEFEKKERPEARPFVVVRLPPPPPKLDGAVADIAISIMPRFRPRIPMPRGVPLRMTTESGSPAEALFRYWCSNRPDTIETAGRLCPPDVLMNGLAALPDRGGLIGDPDAGTVLGAQDQGYTLDEAALRRGWIKPKPPKGQDAQKAVTDKTVGAKSDDVYGGFPWDVTARSR